MVILVDPFILAVPRTGSPDEYRRYLQRLIHWGRAFHAAPGHILSSERAVAGLLKDGCYPTVPEIARAVGISQLSGVSVVDIANIVRILTDTRPYIEAHCNVDDIVFERPVSAQPEVLLSRLTTETRAGREASLACICLRDDTCHQISLGTRFEPFDDDEQLGTFVDVEGTATAIAKCDGTVECEVEFRGRIPLVFDYHGTPAAPVGWDELYQDVPNATRHMFDTEVAPSFPGSNLADVSAGPDFVGSVQRQGLHNNPGILRKIFRLAALAGCGQLASVSGAKLHPVRESIAADADQRKRPDGAALWRCMVTKKGAGFRLHFWAYSNGNIELDCILPESQV